MAKALYGQMGPDPRVIAQMASENRRLRQRVADLEAHVIRLQAENDGLAAASTERLLTFDESMQPA